LEGEVEGGEKNSERNSPGDEILRKECVKGPPQSPEKESKSGKGEGRTETRTRQNIQREGKIRKGKGG